MSNLIKALILALLQLPMFGGAYVLLKQLNQDPVFVAAMAVAYEVVLFAVAFGKKVWATLEPDAVQAVADWIKAVAADARRRFDSSARHYARWVLSEESRVTAFGYDLDLKTKPSVRRIFVNLRLDGAAPSEIIRAPFSPVRRLTATGSGRSCGRHTAVIRRARRSSSSAKRALARRR